ncbi:MAG TPA: carboxypeptidase regulatory-like domain-containing protein [Anaerolineae bacterium]|nr:carboxypeptidase regulatory-like domain-containing protein [Anaerolineae bacterium]
MDNIGLKQRIGTGISLILAVVALLSLGVLLTSASPSAPTADGLWITRVTPLGGASTPFNRLEIQFSSAVLSNTFTLADVSLVGPGGVMTPTALTYLAGDRYELASSGTGLNTYSLVIGPDIRDLSDRQMDQNHNGTAGEPGDAYVGALFSAGVTLTDAQTTYEGQNLLIYGNTAIINGAHTFAGVGVLGGATLSHSPATTDAEYRLDLTITDTLWITAGAKIDVSGRGYLGGWTVGLTTTGGVTGMAGGSYGGLGANANGATNWVYGDYRQPNAPGSGHGAQGGIGAGAGAGGGLVHITAGAAEVEGAILANGGNGVCSGSLDGGGSGGGLWLNVGSLSGGGLIAANGGNGACNGGSGGGGRVAVYYWDSMALPPANVTANGGTGGTGAGQSGSVYISSTPYFVWVGPGAALFHGVEPLEWVASGVNPAQATVDIVAFNAGQPYPLGTGLAPLGSLWWDTTGVPDGQYEVRATFYNPAGQSIGQATRSVLVNNSVVWHRGRLTADETWTADRVHVIESPVSVGAGVTLTVQAGAVVKVAAGASLNVENNAVVDIPATEQAPVILTSLADDSAGGDTNLDGSQTLPIPGEWNGLSVQGTGQAHLSPYVVLRYIKMTHSGTLAGSETWQSTFVHVLTGDVTVPGGATLTLQPGAIVKFGAKLGLTIQAGAQLLAQGTAAQPIVLTSLRDDTVGGDTNRDGSTTTPSAGDWRWINMDGQATLDHVVVAYGGGTASGNWDDTGVIRTNGSAVLYVSNSLIREAFYDGILMLGGTGTVSNTVLTGIDRGVNVWSGATMQVINCTVDRNSTGLLAHGGGLTVINTIVSHNLTYGVNNCCGSSAVVRYSNVWSSSGSNYSGLADPTGTNGNVSVDPQFKDTAGGNYRLRYASPMIDAADGTLAPATDMLGAPRYDDPRTPNTGITTTLGAFADMGAYEFVETAPSDLDLVVDSVVGPLQVTATQSAQVVWTVRNIGVQTVSGDWRDEVALLGPDGAALDVGEFVSGGVLGPNQTATFSVTVNVPGGTEGAYRWQVHTNRHGDVFEGQNWDNNIGQSAGVVSLSVPELVVGQTLPGTLDAEGEALLYKIRPVPGEDVAIQVDRQDDTGWTQLYIGRGEAPTLQRFDARSAQWNQPDARVTIQNADGGVYYLMVLASSLPTGPTAYQLTASPLTFELTSLDLARGGNSGRVTIGLNGAGFAGGMQVSLVQGSVERTAESVSVVDATLAYATFDLQGLAAGAYDVRATVPAASQTLAGAFEVVAGGNRQFKTHILMPDNIRAEREFVAWIEYTNLGDVDLAAPLVLVESPTGCQLRLDRAITLTGASLLFQAVSMDGPAGILRPGHSGRVAVYVRAVRGNNTLNTSYTLEDSTGALDWEQIKAQVKPSTADPDWDTAWAALRQDAGNTWGDYVKVLAHAATLYSVRTGSRSHDPAVSLSYAVLDKLVDLHTVLSGYVYLNDVLHPLGGVNVTAVGPTTDTVSSAVSTADGLVRLSGLAAVNYTLQFGAYLPPADRRPITATVGGPYTWIVTWGGQIGGRVITPPDFDLTAGDYGVTAVDATNAIYHGALDAQGGYRIEGLADGVYTLRFADPALVPVRVTGIQVREGQITHAPDLIAVAGGAIAGTVRQSDTSAPLVGVHVWMSDGSDESHEATSDEQGHYRLDGVLPGIRSVTAAAADHVTQIITNVNVVANAVTADVDLTLATGATLRGVISAQGAPVNKVVVSLLKDDARVGLGISDSAGEYSIAGLTGGVYTVEVASTTYPVFTDTITLVAGQTLFYNVTLTPTALISGVVRTTAGRPLENVLFDLRRPDGAINYGLTDENGWFGFSRLYTGTHLLMLDDGSHRREVNIADIPASLDVSLTITGGSMRGRLLAAEGSTPISAVLVSLAGYQQVALITMSQEDGTFAFSPISPGVYTLTFSSAQAWFPILSDVTVTEGQQTDLGDIRAGSATLNLTFYDLAASQFIAGGGVVLLGRPDLPQPLVEGRVITVDTSGGVSISGLTPGVYRLSSVFAGKATHQALVTVHGGVNTLQTDLDMPATLAGRVTDSCGTPMGDIQLTVYDPAQPALRWQVLSGVGGVFELPTLPPGHYRLAGADLREDPPGLLCGPVEYADLNLAAGATLTYNVVLPVSTLSISGRIQDETGSAPTLAQVTAYSVEGLPVARVQADGDGYYTLRTLAPGTFELRANAMGFAVTPRVITVTAGETRNDVDLTAHWVGLAEALSQESRAARLSLLAAQSPQIEWGDTTWWSETAAFNNPWALKITQWLRDALGSPKAEPRVQSRPPHYDPDCPHGMEYWAIALKYQRAADGFYDGWGQRWDGYMQELGANVGLTAINTLKLLSDFLAASDVSLDGATASYNSVRTQLQSELESVTDPRSIAILENKIDRIDNLHMGMLQMLGFKQWAGSLPGGYISTAHISLPDLISQLQNPKLFSDPAALTSFAGDLAQFGSFISQMRASPMADQLGKLSDVLATLSAGIQTWVDTTASLRDLKNAEADYHNAQHMAHFYAGLASDAFEKCWEDKCNQPQKPPKPDDRTDDDTATKPDKHSGDPNDKGAIGVGTPGYVVAGTPLIYTIHFENVPTATAPAQQIVITDVLDTRLDWSTFELLEIGFNNTVLDVPAGRQFFTDEATVATDSNPVRVTAVLHAPTGAVRWEMRSNDPVTNDWPEDPLAGFLPPNDAEHRGEGYVMFAIRPQAGLADGTTITNQARIVFDVNPPMDTNVVTNTLDLLPPVSQVEPLSPTVTSPFTVTWSGSDSGSGVRVYDLYVATDGGAFVLWQATVTTTQASFVGEIGHQYAFYSVATDAVGQREAAPATPDAVTVVMEAVAAERKIYLPLVLRSNP